MRTKQFFNPDFIAHLREKANNKDLSKQEREDAQRMLKYWEDLPDGDGPFSTECDG